MAEVNIAGIDKVALVQALYANAKCQGMGQLAYKSGPLPQKEAVTLSEAAHLDYVKGRVMKCSVAGDTIRTDLYNRDNGPDAAERIIDTVRRTTK
jgi:hypothetical protein